MRRSQRRRWVWRLSRGAFALAFDLASVSVVAGATTQVTLTLTGDRALAASDRFAVEFSYDPAGGGVEVVALEPVMFTAGSTAAVVTLEAAMTATDGVLEASVLDVDGATVTPATLSVEIVPRAFVLAFAAPDGTPPLAVARVLAGGTTEVVVALENPDVLMEDEQLLVSLQSTTVTVIPPELTLTREQPSISLTIAALFDAVPPLGTIIASGEVLAGGAAVDGTKVIPVALSVEIAPRHFRLSLSPGARPGQFSATVRPSEMILTGTRSVGSSIAVAESTTIKSLAVRVEISGVAPLVLLVRLRSPGGADVLLHGQTGGTELGFERAYTSRDHAGLAALAGESAQGEWTLMVTDFSAGGSSIGTLEAWGLEINGFAPVLAGGSAAVTASLAAVETPLGTPRLFADETLTVTLAYNDGTGVALSPTPVTFDAESTAVGVTLDATPDATPGTLTAVVASTVPANVEVAPAALPVEIAPRRFRLSLSGAPADPARRIAREARPHAYIPYLDFAPLVSTITVTEGITIESLVVGVAISHPARGELSVVLTLPGGTTVTLHSPNFSDLESDLVRAYTSVGDDAGLAALVGGSAQGDWLLTVWERDVSATESAGTLESWYLEINTGAQVIAGESVPVVATLSGLDTPFGASRLFAGERLEVDWTYTDGVGVTLPPVVFQVASPTSSVEVAATLTATLDATTGVGVLELSGDGLKNAEVEPVSVPVEIVPRAFTLVLDVPSVSVLAGGTTEVVVALADPRSLEAGESVQVSLSTQTPGIVVTGGLERTLTVGESSASFIIEAAHDAPMFGTMTASGEVVSGGSVVVNTEVVSVTLSVEVVPRMFRLFVAEPGSEYVVAGGSTEVVVGITGVDTPLGPSRLDASETLQVDFVYTDGEGVTLSPVSLNAGNSTGTATLMASLAATSGVLQLTGSGLENAVVAPASLAIEVLPGEFRLMFEPSQIGILTGTTETVVLSLSGASQLPAGDEVLVELLLNDASTVSVVSTVLSFGASTTNHVVSLHATGGSQPGETTLFAAVLLSPTALSDAIFVDAELAVNIIELRRFSWVFRSVQSGERLSEQAVVAGASTQFLVSLEGDFGERLTADEQVQATLTSSSPLDLVVDPVTVILRRDLSQLVTLSAATDAARGTGAQLQLMSQSMLGMAETETGSTLPVRVVHEVVLSFTASGGAALVLAGGTTEVVVALDNPGLLEMGEVVRVSLSTEIVIAVPSSLTLTLATPRATFTIGAAYDVPLTLGKVIASGRVLSGGVLAANTRVVSTALAVEVVARRFRLEILSEAGTRSSPLRVLAGASTPLRLRLLGVGSSLGIPSLGADEMLTAEFTYIDGSGVSLSSQRVTFSRGSTEARVVLSAAVTATSGTLTAEAVAAAEVESTALAVEIVPRAFTLTFDPASVSVVAGATAQVTLTLTGDTELIGEDEAIEVTFAYDSSDPAGGGVRVARPAVFTAGSTAAVVMLEAATTATDGELEASVLDVDGATVTPATLDVGIVPRAFVLAFDASTVSVIAGATTQVTLTLTGDRALAASDRFAATFTYASSDPDGGVRVVGPVEFTAGSTAAVVILEAATTATGGVLTASAPEAEGATVTPATLDVGIVPRAFVLAFDLASVSVVAGATTQVTLTLTGDRVLAASDRFAVTFTYASSDPDGGVRVAGPVEFTAGSTATVVTLEAATTATGGELEASVLDVDGATVAPATLAVEIVPRLFTLVFDLASVSVVAGATRQVTLTLTGDHALAASDRFAVEFSYDLDGGVEVVALEPMIFTTDSTAAVVTLEAATTATGDVLEASVLNVDGATVAPATLAVEIVPRLFTLAFDPASVSVVAGATAQVTLTLTGDRALAASDRFAVEFSYDLDGGVEVVALEPVIFTTDSTAATVTLEAAMTATDGVLEASVLDVDGATVTAATLAVEIVPRLFTLAFDPASVSVVAGATAQVTLTLTGDTELIGDDEAIEVTFAYDSSDPAGGGVRVARPAVFTAGSTAAVVTLEAATTATDGVLEASVLDVDGATVTAATLDVEIVPRLFTLAFDPASVSVVAGATTQVTLTLTGDRVLAASDRFAVEFAYDPDGGVQVVEPVEFSEGTTAAVVTLEAATIATDGVLEASVLDVDGATVTPATLAVEIVPRAFTLAFDLASVSVVAGAMTQVTLTLTGDRVLAASDRFAVEFAYAPSDPDGGGVEVVALEPVTFSMDSTEVTVTLEAATTATGGVLEASVAEADGAAVAAATLAVEIVPRAFALAFDLASVSVVAGATRQVTLTLTGDRALAASDRFAVEFAYAPSDPDGGGVEVVALEPVTFSMDSNAAVVTLSAATTATGGVLEASVLDVDGATVAPATLAVEIVPRLFTLAFDLASVSVVAGATTQVTLTLTGDRALAASDRFAATFTYAPSDPDGGVQIMKSVMFTAGSTAVVVTLEAATTAAGGVLTALVPEADGAAVTPATLGVEIVPRAFALVFDLASVSVVAGATTQVTLTLTGDRALAASDRFAVEFSYDPAGGGVEVVALEPVMFTAGSTAAVVTLEAAMTATDGELEASVLDVDGATVTPTTLSVEIVPRTFVLAFAAPDGTPPLAVARVLAGGTTEVVVALENPDVLMEDEQLLVSLQSTTVTVIPPELTLTREQPGISLTIAALFDAVPPLGMVVASGEVRQLAGGAAVDGTKVIPVALPVEIAPRRFRLSLSPGARPGQFSATVRPNEIIHTGTRSVGSSITVAESTTIKSLAVRVEISGVSPLVLQVRLRSPGGADVLLHGQTGGTELGFERAYTSRDHAGLAALAGESAQGEWTLMVADFSSGTAMGTLEAWGLEINGFAPVLAGGSAAVTASLVAVETPLGTPRLFAGETLAVTLAYNDGTGVALSGPPVTFDAESSAVGVTLDAAPDATPGTLTAVVAGAVPVNVEVAPAALPVEISPRRFRLSLSGAPADPAQRVAREARPHAYIPYIDFAPLVSTITVTEGITIESLVVGVAISHPDRSELGVVLTLPGGTTVTLYSPNLSDVESDLVRAYTSVSDAGLAALVGGSAQGDWSLTVRDVSATESAGTLESWYLEINTGAQVIAGESVPVVATLSGLDTPFGASRLFAGETLTAGWTYTDGVGVTLPPVVFQVASPTSSVEVAATLTATLDATTGVGVLELSGDGLKNAEVEPVSVPVEIVPRAFTLVLDVPSVSVLAGGTTEVVVALADPRSLEAGESVRVSLSTQTPGIVVTGELERTLTVGESSASFIIEAAHDAPMFGTMIASGEVVSTGSVVVNTEVVSVTLSVEVVPRMFRLFVAEPGSEYVVAGGSTEVVVGITGVDTPLGPSRLDASETLQVDFVYTDGEGVTLSPVSLNAGNSTGTATVMASLAATSGVLQLTGSGLENAMVAPASLAIEVLPGEFRLMFEPSQIGILTGTTETVVLSLSGASQLPAGDEVLVELLLNDASTVSVVSTVLSFGASTTNHVVSLHATGGSQPGETTLFAAVLLSPTALSDAIFVDAELAVNIIELRRFSWVFRSVQSGERLSEQAVVAGASTQFLVSLEGDFGERLTVDEQVQATLTSSSPLDLVVDPVTVILRRDLSQLVTLSAATDAARGTGAQLQLVSQPMLGMAETEAESALPVRVVHELVLSFTASGGAARVLAGGTTVVEVSLVNPQLLTGEDEAVEVSFTTEVVTIVGGGNPGLRLTRAMPGMSVIIGAAYDVPLTLGKVIASGRVLSGGVLAADTRVVSTALAVEVVARRFRLEILSEAGTRSSPLRVLAGASTPLRLRLLGVGSSLGIPSLGADEMLTAEFTYIDGSGVSLSSQRVTFFRGSTETTVVLSAAVTATSGTLTADAIFAMAEAFDEIDTVVESAMLAVEIVPRAFALTFDPASVSVVAGATTQVTLTLTGDTELIGDDEAIEVTFAYAPSDPADGDVRVARPAVFTAGSTAAVVILEAATTATGGVLTASAPEAEGATVAPATLAVEIVPRLFTLAFDPASVSVVAGATRQVTLTLTGDRALAASDRFAATFTYASSDPDGGVRVVEPVEFTAGSTAAVVILEAATTATGGVLTASAPEADGAAVAPATLDVGIVPRAFVLAFDLASVSVVAGATTQVTLTLTGDRVLAASDRFAVTFTYASSDPDGGVRVAGPVEFTAGSTAAVVILEAATTATGGVLTASAPEAEGATVAPATLAVEIVPRLFTLAFDLASVSVVAGATAQVTLTLTGDRALAASDRFVVEFTYDLDGGVQVAGPVEFTAGSTATVVTLEAATTATDGVLEASVLDVDGATVAPATLDVEIVPRLFTLAFDLASVSVVAGATAQVTLTLTGDRALTASDRFAVEFSYDLDGGVEVVALEPVIFTTDSTAAVVTLEAATTATDGVLTASVLDVDGATVTPATLDVEITPRAFVLAFNASTVSVIAGATTQVTLTLTGDRALAASDRFAVEFSYDLDGGVQVVEPVEFTAGSTATVVTLEVETDATDGVLEASVLDVDGATVTPATLDVEIVPRAFTLAFDLASVSVIADATTQVTLTLTGDRALAASDRFAVEFAYVPSDPDGGGVEVVALELVTFTTGSTAAVVTLEAATTATDGVLEASVPEADGAAVAPATLDVEIVPRAFVLAFDASTVSVIAGATTQVTLTLTGDRALAASDRFAVEFAYVPSDPDGGGVEVVALEPVTFTTDSTEVTVTLEAATTATDGVLTASVPEADGAAVTPATLAVGITPRAFALAFGASTVSVIAGATTQVTLTLTGDRVLAASDRFAVEFSYDLDGGVRVAGPVEFTAGSTATVVTLEAATTATGGVLEASVLDVDGATVAPATLDVEIVPRAFTLAFDASTVSVIAGATTQVTLTLTGDRALAASDRFAATFTYAPSDPDGGVQIMKSVMFTAGSTAVVVTLEAATTAAGGVLTALVPEADGAAVTAATLGVEIVPRAFALVFDLASVSVVAGATTQVTLTLTGDRALAASDRFAVEFSYDPAGGGVEVVALEPVMFTAGSTAAVVTLEAAMTATDGELEASVLDVDGATVAPATLSVEIVPRMLVLAFAAPDGTPPLAVARVLAGGTTEVVVALENPDVLMEDEQLLVSLQPTTVTVIPSELTLTREQPSISLTIAALFDAVPPLGTIIASGEVLAGGAAVDGTKVIPVALSVEIAPRHFRLSLSPGARPGQFSATVRPNEMILTGTRRIVESSITVAEPTTIKSLAVRVEISGAAPLDLLVRLRSPRGSGDAVARADGRNRAWFRAGVHLEGPCGSGCFGWRERAGRGGH